MTYTFGVDLSRYQTLNSVDFDKMRGNELQFAIAKATEGDDYQDPEYERHVNLARKHNMVLGAYHFLDPDDDIEGQVDNFLSTTDGLFIQPDFYVLDVEKPGISPLEVAVFVADFPYELGVYSRENILSPKYEKVRHLFAFEWLAHYVISGGNDEKIWLKHLQDFDPTAYGPDLPPAPLWQFTDALKFTSPDGKENVDGNIFLGDMQAFLRYVGALSP